MKVDVVNVDNQCVGEAEISGKVVDTKPKNVVLHSVVKWQLAKRRKSVAKTKDRSLVSGTRAKPFNQKGGGRARQGSRITPQFRGGGVVFGPVTRSFSYNLPKKVRKLGLRMAFVSKLLSKDLVVVDDSFLGITKTADMAKKFGGFEGNSYLIVGESFSQEFRNTVSNLFFVNIIKLCGLNVYDILKCDKLFVFQSSLDKIQERLC